VNLKLKKIVLFSAIYIFIEVVCLAIKCFQYVLLVFQSLFDFEKFVFYPSLVYQLLSLLKLCLHRYVSFNWFS